MSPLRLLALLGPAVLLTSAAGAARAEPVTAALQWRMPAGSPCLAEHALARLVEQRLDRQVFVPVRHADLWVRGRAWRSPGAWHAELSLHSPDGQMLGRRTLQSAQEGCAELDDEVVLVVAIFVDLSRRELEALERAAAARHPEPPPRLPTRPLRQVDRTAGAGARDPWAFGARLGGIVSVGLLPAPAPGIALGETVDAPGLWPVDASLALWPGVSSGDGRGQFAAWTARLRSCPALVPGPRVELTVCAGLGAGSIRGTGRNLASAQTRVRGLVWGELAGRVSVRILGPLWVGIELGAAVPWTRDRFLVRGAGGLPVHVHQAAPVVGLGSLEVAVRAP